MRPQHSLDRLKNAGKPWKERVTPHTVCVSLKSERNPWTRLLRSITHQPTNRLVLFCLQHSSHLCKQRIDVNLSWFLRKLTAAMETGDHGGWEYLKLSTSCHISNTRDRDIQTPRRGLKIRRAVEYFWRNSRCLDIRWNTVWSVWYIFSIETKTKE